MADLPKTGVAKLVVWQDTLGKNVAAEDRTLSLQIMKIYSLYRHIHIENNFCISHLGTFNAIYTVIV